MVKRALRELEKNSAGHGDPTCNHISNLWMDIIISTRTRCMLITCANCE